MSNWVSMIRCGASTFEVVVGSGDNCRSYTIHEGLARQESGFFDAALNRGWKESENRTVYIPGYHSNHFELFFAFIYHRVIFSSKGDDLADPNSHDREWMRLAHAWALDNYLQATDFKDAITDAIIEKTFTCKRDDPAPTHRVIYPESLPGTPIRMLMVQIAFEKWSSCVLKAERNDSSWSDFFFDLAVRSHEIEDDIDTEDLCDRDICHYHEHRVSNTPCYRGKSMFA